MGHRDDHESQRARIDALERDLREAEARAERAEAAAAEARAGRGEAQRAAAALAAEAKARAEPTRPRKKSRAERRREAREAPAATGPSGPWPSELRAAYVRQSRVVTLVVCGALAGAVLPSIPLGEEAVMARAGPGSALAVVALALAHAVVGRRTQAPSPANGAISTLLSASAAGAVGLGLFVAIEAALAPFAPPFAVVTARALATLASIGACAFVTAAWSADAASSESSGD